MNKTKKIAIFTFLPIAVIFLSGCGKQTTPVTTPAPQATPAPTGQSSTSPKPATSTDSLPALPANNKQAIDNEMKGIDQAIQETDSALSEDIQDSELGI